MQLSDFVKWTAWEFLNPLLLKIRKNKIFKFEDSYRGLNLGCGLDNPPHWLGIDGGISVVVKHLPSFLIRLIYRFQNTAQNVDVNTFIDKIKSADIIHFDLKYGLPFADATVPNIYTSHFLEHLTRENCVSTLRECQRIMKPGGLLRVCVPSLHEEVEKIRKALDRYDTGDIVPIERYVTQSKSGYLSVYSNHRWMYNFDEMKKVLTEAGFVNVTEMDYKKGQLPDVEILDRRGGLHVEAMKP